MRQANARGARCPGGYLIGTQGRLCGASGNRCIDKCAFAYRDQLGWWKTRNSEQAT